MTDVWSARIRADGISRATVSPAACRDVPSVLPTTPHSGFQSVTSCLDPGTAATRLSSQIATSPYGASQAPKRVICVVHGCAVQPAVRRRRRLDSAATLYRLASRELGVANPFAAFRPRAAGTLNSLSREVPVERAAELQAQHRGDLVEFEGAA